MRVIIACGGTGGHITPALAIADTIKANVPLCHILFFGTRGGMENTIVSQKGYEIYALEVEGISRKNPLRLPHSLMAARRAVKAAREEIVRSAPDIVIGTGGYACYPALAAAAALGIPTAVHESNAVPGLAVRLLAPRLSRVWLGFEAAQRQLSRRASVRVVGNPLPFGFAKAFGTRGKGKGDPCVLSFGGSLGAPAINKAILDLMGKTRHLENVRHVHATGRREWEAFSREFASRGLDKDERIEILPFISDMPRRMREATVVVSRAGAMSISEIATAGRASVLIPSPNVTGDHQLKNALELARSGAALLVEEHTLPDGMLSDAVVRLLRSDGERERMEEAVTRFASPKANQMILEDIVTLLSEKGRK